MRESFTAITIILFAKLPFALAQPALTDENTLRPLIGLTVEFRTFEAAQPGDAEHLVGFAGENQTWDVSNLDFSDPADQPTYYSEPRPDMPTFGDPRLAEANVVAISDPDVGTWTYQRLDETGYYVLGRTTVKDFDMDGRKDTLVTIFAPVSRVYPFPLTMGTAWTDSTTQTLEFQGSPPVPTETVVASHAVEGWGTLVSPDGMFPALRIRTEARVTGSGGQKSTQRTIRILTPVPDGLVENNVYASHTELVVDSTDNLIGLSYVSLTAHRPTPVESQGPFAEGVRLDPNYPNPFQGATTIPFQVGDVGHVRIAVFDIIGRRISEILNETLHPGAHRVTWEAGSVSSGIYRVLLETRTSAASRLIVIRR